MYAYARIKSILREITDISQEDLKLINYELLDQSHERKLLGMLNDFNRCVEFTTENYKPLYLCVYLYNLAKEFSRYYENVSIKKSKTKELQVTRLQLIKSIAEILKVGLNLLGINVLEKM